MQHALRTRQWNALKNADSTNVKNSIPTKHKATQDDSTKDGPPRPKRAALGEITEALSSTLIDSSKKTNAGQSQEIKIETATTVRLAPLAEHEYTEKLEIADESAFDFDKENNGDPYAVSDFVRDIFQYYKHREAKFQVGDYFCTKTFFTNELRAKLVNWLIEVQETFELNHETLYLSVKLMDMYFARVTKLEKSAVLLVACTAIFVASKMEERQVPGIDDLIHMTRLQEPSSRYTTRLMKAMERDFLRTVGYDLGAPLSYSFLRRYSRVCGMGMASLTQARYFLEQSLHFLDFCRVSDSRLAAAALLLALRVTDSGDWVENSTLEKCTGYKLEDVEPIMWCLNHMSRRFSAVLPRARTVLEKYSHKVFYEVAKMPLLRDCRGERNARKPSIEVPPELQFKFVLVSSSVRLLLVYLLLNAMVRHRKLDYQFLSVIFQLRMVQLLALPLAMLTLAMEVEKITSAAFLFPLLFMIFNFYIVFSRCYESVDGRFDYRAMLSAPELSSKIEYFCDLFLPSIFALVTHFVAPELQSSFTSMVFRLSDYFVLDCAIATAVVECVEGQRLSYL